MLFALVSVAVVAAAVSARTVQVRNGSEFATAISDASKEYTDISRIELKDDIVLMNPTRFTGGQQLTIDGNGNKISGPSFNQPLLLVNRAPSKKGCGGKRTCARSEWTWEGPSAESFTVQDVEFVDGSFGVDDVVGAGMTYTLSVKKVKVSGAGKGSGRFGICGKFTVDGEDATINIDVDESDFKDCDEEGLWISGGTAAKLFNVNINETSSKRNNRQQQSGGGLSQRSLFESSSYISYLQSLGAGIFVQSFAVGGEVTCADTKSNSNIGSGIVIRVPDDDANVTVIDCEADENGGFGIVIVASGGFVVGRKRDSHSYTMSGPTQVTIDDSHANDNRYGNAFLWASALQATIKDSEFNGAKEGDNLTIMGMTDSLLFAWAHSAGFATMPWAQITDSEANGSLIGNGLVTDSIAVLLDNFDAEKNNVNGYLFAPYSPNVFMHGGGWGGGWEPCEQDNGDCVEARSIGKFQPPPPVEIEFTGGTSKFEKNGAYGIFVQRVNPGRPGGNITRISKSGRPRPPPSTPIVNLYNVDLDGNGSGSLIGDVLIAFDTTSPSLPMPMKKGRGGGNPLFK